MPSSDAMKPHGYVSRLTALERKVEALGSMTRVCELETELREAKDQLATLRELRVGDNIRMHDALADAATAEREIQHLHDEGLSDSDTIDALQAQLATIAEQLGLHRHETPIIADTARKLRARLATLEARLAALASREPSEAQKQGMILAWTEGHTFADVTPSIWGYVRDCLLADERYVLPCGHAGWDADRCGECGWTRPVKEPQMTTTAFEKALEALINQHSIENASNTPDWILAQYLLGCLAAWNTGVQQRETWYGRDASPSAQTVPPPPAPTEAGSAPPVMLRLRHAITSNYMVSLNSQECEDIIAELARLRAAAKEK